MLQFYSVISTTSSFSQLFQTARNRPHLQQINQIGAGLIPIVSRQTVSCPTADTAISHWGAGVNGDDIEFVFGTTDEQRPSENPSDFQSRAVCLFLLDFGQCDIVDLSQECKTVHWAFKGWSPGYSAAGTTVFADKRLHSKFDMKVFMQQYEEYA
ncbi:unnamed protein product [Penicillium salamii]|nr:unnamed protein product [Penicillium salamii]